MSVNLRKSPNFGKTEKYGDSTLRGLIRFYEPAGYLQLEDDDEGRGFNIVWPTEMGSLEALRSMLSHQIVNNGDGSIRKKGGKWVDCTTAQVLQAVQSEPDNVHAFSVDDDEGGFSWFKHDTSRWKFTDIVHNEIGMTVNGINRERVGRIILETIVDEMKPMVDTTLDDFATTIGPLQRA